MKTTVKLECGQMFDWVRVRPADEGAGIVLEAGPAPTEKNFVSIELTEDRAGALIFGIERAAEAARIAQERAAESLFG